MNDELLNNEEKLERCLKILDNIASLTEVKVFVGDPPMYIFNCAETIVESVEFVPASSATAYTGVSEVYLDITKYYNEDTKSGSLKGWGEMAADLSTSLKLEELRMKVLADREAAKTSVPPQPTYSQERWIKVKACFENDQMIEMLKELVEDRERIAKLKYHRLNLLL